MPSDTTPDSTAEPPPPAPPSDIASAGSTGEAPWRDRGEPPATIDQTNEHAAAEINANAWLPRQRALHWVVAFLVVAQLLIGASIGSTVRSPGPHPDLPRLFAIHGGIGTLIFVLMLWRLMLRESRPLPAPPPGTPGDATVLAHANHRLFYAILLFMPIIGWFTVGAAGHNLSFFGLFDIPAPIGKDPVAARVLARIHGATAVFLLGAIAAHLAGVWYHTSYRRDGLLRRMLP